MRYVLSLTGTVAVYFRSLGISLINDLFIFYSGSFSLIGVT